MQQQHHDDAVFTKSTMHRLMMRGDPVAGARTQVGPGSVIERILAHIHFETPKRVVSFSLGHVGRAHQVETYSVDREETRELIQRGINYVAQQPHTNVVLAAFAAFVKSHPTRILVGRTRLHQTAGFNPWRPRARGEPHTLTVPSFVDPVTGRVDTIALHWLVRGMQQVLFSRFIDTAAATLDTCLAKDHAHRGLLDPQHLPAAQLRLWNAIVNEVEREPAVFGGAYDANSAEHRRIMRAAVLVRPCEHLAFGATEADLEFIAPYTWRFLHTHVLPQLQQYAHRHGIDPLPPRENLPPLHNSLLVPVAMQVEVNGKVPRLSHVEPTVRRAVEPFLARRVEPTVVLNQGFWAWLGTLVSRYLQA